MQKSTTSHNPLTNALFWETCIHEESLQKWDVHLKVFNNYAYNLVNNLRKVISFPRKRNCADEHENQIMNTSSRD